MLPPLHHLAHAALHTDGGGSRNASSSSQRARQSGQPEKAPVFQATAPPTPPENSSLGYVFMKNLFDKLLDNNENILAIINGIFDEQCRTFLGIPTDLPKETLTPKQQVLVSKIIVATSLEVEPAPGANTLKVQIRIENFCDLAQEIAAQLQKKQSVSFLPRLTPNVKYLAAKGSAELACRVLTNAQNIKADVVLSYDDSNLIIQVANAASQQSNTTLWAALLIMRGLDILPGKVPWETINKLPPAPEGGAKNR